MAARSRRAIRSPIRTTPILSSRDEASSIPAWATESPIVLLTNTPRTNAMMSEDNTPTAFPINDATTARRIARRSPGTSWAPPSTLGLMVVETVHIPVADATVTGRLARGGKAGVLLAHGAGTDQDHAGLVALRDGLAGSGLTVLTFNYRYTELGRKRPDSQPVLLATHRAARDYLENIVGGPVFLAGRSMGGRMGTYLAAAGEPCRGVICYAYPLHPPGRTDKLRADHLSSIQVPILFFQGTRDSLSRMDLFDEYVRPLPLATIEILEGADHSFRGSQYLDRMVERTAEWIAVLTG
jgi:predicted alpha/beta-hydrolase family hydrolase